MKTPSTFLHELIQSLNPGEKRFFRIWAKQHQGAEQQNYLKLFHAIEKQEVYNEKKLKQKFRNENMVRYFSTAKTQLKEIILDALHEYHLNQSLAEQVKRQLHQVFLITDRGFVEEAKKRLSKTKLAIQSSGLDYLMMEAHQVEQVLFSKLFTLQSEGIEAFALENKSSLERLDTQLEQWRLLHELYIHYFRQMNPRTEEQLAVFKSVSNHPFFNALPGDANIQTQMEHAHMRARYWSIIGKKKDAQQEFKRALDLYELFPDLKAQQSSKYINLLNNYLMECSGLRDYEPFDRGIQELKSIANHSKQLNILKAQAFTFSHILQSEKHWREREFESLLPFLPDIESGLMKYEGLIQAQYVLLFYNALFNTYFILENYDQALNWMEKIMSDRKLDSFQGVQAIARIWNLLIHYELKNFMLLESILVSSKRYFQNRSIYFDAERLFLQSFQKVVHLPEGQERIQEFKNLKETLIPLQDHPFEKQVFHYFSLIEWVDSKILAVSFRDVLAKKQAGASD